MFFSSILEYGEMVRKIDNVVTGIIRRLCTNIIISYVFFPARMFRPK